MLIQLQQWLIATYNWRHASFPGAREWIPQHVHRASVSYTIHLFTSQLWKIMLVGSMCIHNTRRL